MPSDPSQPIFAYTERLPQVKRVLHLFPDRVEIAAKWTLGKDYKSTVRLDGLTPQFKLHTLRNRWFKRSIMIGSLAVAVAVVFARGEYPDWVKHNAPLAWAIAGVCAIVAFRSLRKRRYARFSRKDGSPGLDVFDAGPDRARFDEFLREIQKCIRRSDR